MPYSELGTEGPKTLICLLHTATQPASVLFTRPRCLNSHKIDDERAMPRSTTITLVAVRFAENVADLRWLGELVANVHVVVVNKGGPLLGLSPNVTVLDTHENICREGFGYLWALDRLPLQGNGLVIFTQAKLKLKEPQAFNQWLAAVSAAQHRECFSFFGGVIPGRVSTITYGSSLPYLAGTNHGPGAAAFKNTTPGYRSQLICPNESWRQWTQRTQFGPGGTFAVSSSLLAKIPSSLIVDAMGEFRSSSTLWGPPHHSQRMYCMKEYVYERSWRRLLTRCNNSVPSCTNAPS